MIATLNGLVSEKMADLVVLDVHGLGYGVLVPVEDYGHLQTGDMVKLYIHEHIRENSHDLYGFCKLDSMELFEQLLDVSGVGPKMALGILSIAQAQEVRSAIAGGDTKFIQAAPGVGKKVAERVVVELRDKVGLPSSLTDRSAIFMASTTAQTDEAVQALIALGYDVHDAINALVGIDESLSTENRIKQALRGSAL